MPLPVPGQVPAGVAPRENATVEAMLRQLWDRLSESERKTLFSAVISSGGLTVQDGGALRVRLASGVEIFYAGPLSLDGVSYQGIIMRRSDGTPLFFTFPVAGDVNKIAWTWRDHLGAEVLASDAATGGLARPWIPVNLVSLISMPASTVFGYYNTAVSTSERQMWEGRIPLVSHPYIELDGLWGQASGSNNNTYRLKVNGTTVGTWVIGGGLSPTRRGPFDISAFLQSQWASIEVTMQSTGTGSAACHVTGCALRQTP